LLTAAGHHLTTAVDRYVHRSDAADVGRTSTELRSARERADAAFEDLAHQNVGKRPPDTDWTAVLALTSRIGLVGDLMGWAADTTGGVASECSDVGALLVEEASELRSRLDADAAVAAGADGEGRPAARPLGSPGAAGRLAAADRVHAAIATHLADGPATVDRVGPILHSGWAHQWLELVADSLVAADDPVAEIGAYARRPWWR
jgi:hypothetical protein